MGEVAPFAAFVDESGSDRMRDPGAYILSAAIIDRDALEVVRKAMQDLKPRSARKLHWRETDVKGRLMITETLASLPIEHLVVVRDNAIGQKDERRRRACLKRMTFELDQLGVDEVTLESRGPHDDRRDLYALGKFRATRLVSSTLRMHHLPGPAEPLLWVPDAVCGAMVEERVGLPKHWELLEAKCTVINCT